MTSLLDTSILVASLDPDEPAHDRCNDLLAKGGHRIFVHAIAETFSTLTGGARGRRADAVVAVRLLEQSILPFVRIVALTDKDVMTALRQAQDRGVRGGAVYDYLHLVAAAKAGAKRLLTLDRRHFETLRRTGDPAVETP